MSRVKKKLNRQIKRHLVADSGLQPDIDFIQNLLDVPIQDRDDDIYQKILDGLPEFLSLVEKSYELYEDKNRMAFRNLELSSQELNGVNTKLRELNQSIKAMLESLESALLFFDKEGLCSPIFSQSCLDLLEINPAGKSIWGVLNQKDKDIDKLKSLVDFSFSNNSALSFDDIFLMAPSFFVHSQQDRIVAINYKPIYDSEGNLCGVLVIAEDKTEEEEAKERLRQKERYASKILRIIHSRNDYAKVLKRNNLFFLSGDGALYKQESAVKNILYELHTIKGNSASFYMDDLVDIIHDIEDYTESISSNIDDVKNKIQESLPAIQLAMDEEQKQAEDILGSDAVGQGDVRAIQYKHLERFYSLIIKPEYEHIPFLFGKSCGFGSTSGARLNNAKISVVFNA